MAKRGLPAAGTGDQRDSAPLFNGKRKAVDYLCFPAFGGFIAEAHIFKTDSALQPLRLERARRVGFDGNVHNLQKTRESRHSVLQLFKNGHNTVDRLEQHVDVQQKRRNSPTSIRP